MQECKTVIVIPDLGEIQENRDANAILLLYKQVQSYM